MKFIVDKSYWNLFPDSKLGVLLLKNIQNGESTDEIKSILKEANNEDKKYLTKEILSENPVIAVWREAYKKFKTKKGVRSSIEALLKRVSQGREFNPINPLVDIYNSVSLSYAVPCGGEDVAKIQGGLHLGKAQGGEPFFPLGAETDAPALPEEIIYYDNEGAVCRCFNWREAQRTMLTEGTTDAVLVIEAINEDQAKRAQAAMQELQGLVEDYFGVKGEITHLTIDNPSVDI